MGKCKFQNNWLQQTDKLGYKISLWCRKYKKTDEEAHCTVCEVSINVKKEFQALSQHVQSTKHAKNIAAKQGPLQLHLELASSASFSQNTEQSVSLQVCLFVY